VATGENMYIIGDFNIQVEEDREGYVSVMRTNGEEGTNSVGENL
jgi:hypothetical protein